MLKEVAPGPDQRSGGDPPNGNGPSVIQKGGVSSRLTLDQVLDILGSADGEYTAVCHRPVGGQFASSVVKSFDVSTQVKSLPEPGCVWFSVNPTAGPQRHNQGRGREREVTRWAGLYLDVDVKPGGFPGLDKAADFVGVLSAMIGTRPSMIIHSGHGLQPVWPIEDGELNDEVKWARAYRLSRRFGRIAARMAANHSGAALDTASDLCRVLRVPGTVNWKDPAKPVPAYAVSDGGGPLTVDGIEDFVDEWAADIESDHPVVGEVMSPPDSWSFGRATCPYVRAMVSSWMQEPDRPRGGRHQWAMTRCVRLAAAHRLGCITGHCLDQALVILESALKHWCLVTGLPRDLAPDEVGSAYRWAQAKVATFNDLCARSQLGYHQHSSAQPRTWTLVRR